jgi:Xaa-Pro aminopeptidase
VTAGLADELARRHREVADGLAEIGADCLLTVRDESVTYLTGYTTMSFKMHSRPIAVLLTTDAEVIVVAPETEADAAEARIPGATVHRYVEMDAITPGGRLPDGHVQFAPAAGRAVAAVVHELGAKTVGVDGLAAAWPPIGQLTALMPQLDGRTVDASQLIWTARLGKSAWELERMKAAAQVLAAAYGRLREELAPGMTEREIARAFTIAQWEAGAHEIGPLGVVADPSRGLFGAPTDRVWERGELLYVDGAAIVDGYWSDFCRTFAAHTPTGRERAGYARAYKGLEAAHSQPRTADEFGTSIAAHLEIRPADVGFGRFGHGIGLHTPEPPSLHPADTTPIRDGMVLCVEPAVEHEGLNFVVEEEHAVVDGSLVMLSPPAPTEILTL